LARKLGFLGESEDSAGDTMVHCFRTTMITRSLQGQVQLVDHLPYSPRVTRLASVPIFQPSRVISPQDAEVTRSFAPRYINSYAHDAKCPRVPSWTRHSCEPDSNVEKSTCEIPLWRTASGGSNGMYALRPWPLVLCFPSAAM